jgi:hypothetical protein
MSVNMNDPLVKQMISEGVNKKDFEAKPHFYKKCPLCIEPISDTRKPVLLKCGHILC